MLTRRALNRALLARQLLLERDARLAGAAIEHLAGLQAQLARPPFIALWSRLRDFDRQTLLDAVHARTVVRVTSMRGTLHLLPAADYLTWRAPLQAALTRGLSSIVGPDLASVPLSAVEKTARAFLTRAPATFEAIRNHLEPRYPDHNVRHLAYALRMTLPLVQVPELGQTWGYPGAADFALADRWLGCSVATRGGSAEDMIRRYLGAFGPASVADAQSWSGIPRLAPVFEALRGGLVTFRDEERGRELFDLPDAPRPDPDTVAPIRLLPDWDSALLGHHDRSRIIADEFRARIATRNLQVTATFIVDGMVAGAWSLARKGKRARLVLEPFLPLVKRDRAALEAEAERLLAFAEPEAVARDVEYAG